MSASAVTTVDLAADLAITNEGQAGYAGNELTWAVQVTNGGPSAASGAVIRSSVPAPTDFVRADTDSGTCSYDAAARTVICHPDVIHPGGLVTVHIVTRTPPDMVPPGQAFVTVADPATVEYEGDPNLDNNTATAFSVVYALAELALAKTAAPAPLVAGDLAVYHATVTNHGPSTATGISYTDVLPEGLRFDPAASDPRCTRDGTPPEIVRCAVGGPMGPGGHVTFRVAARIDPTLGDHSDVVNDAIATAAQANEAIAQARARSAVVRRVDVGVTKTVSMNPVPQGMPFSYTIRVVNHGPSAASMILVADHASGAALTGGLAPSHPTGVSCPGPERGVRCAVHAIASSCTARGVSFRCEVPELFPGAGATFTVTAMTPPGTPDGAVVCDTARARAAEFETHPVDNHASVCTTIVARFVPVTGLGPCRTPCAEFHWRLVTSCIGDGVS